MAFKSKSVRAVFWKKPKNKKQRKNEQKQKLQSRSPSVVSFQKKSTCDSDGDSIGSGELLNSASISLSVLLSAIKNVMLVTVFIYLPFSFSNLASDINLRAHEDTISLSSVGKTCKYNTNT